MANAEYNGRKWAYLAIPFSTTDVTTGASNVDLTFGAAGNTVWIAPRSGKIVAVTANCEAITAGGIQLTPHKQSVEYAQTGVPSPTLDSNNDTNGTYADIREGAITFAAGDGLGISATATTTALNPTNTLDVSASLIVALDPA